MKKLSYFAILEKNNDGELWARFPDFDGCISYGKDIAEAIENSQEALSLHIYGMQKDNETIPEPSKNVNAIQNEIVVLITVYPELFRMKMESKRVKVNCTIPQWIKTQAEEKNINFSKVLENALQEEVAL